MVTQRDSSSQPATRAQFDWPLIDEELFSMIFPLREALNSDAISTDEAASALSSHLGDSGVLRPQHSYSGPHRDRAIIGHFLPETIAQMATACEVPKKTIRSLFEQAARIAVSCSYRIFNSRASPGWDLLDHLR